MEGLFNMLSANIWVFLVAIYGICKGLREGVKKKAMQKSDMENILFFYTAIGFLFSVPFVGNPFDIPPMYYIYVILKSFFVFAAWLLSFPAVKKMPIGYYGILDMARILFSTFWGILILNEVLSFQQMLGLSLVLLGVLIINLRRSSSKEGVSFIYIVMALASCFFNSISALIDKLIMTTGNITTGQLQFWFMFFMVVMYLIFMMARHKKPDIKSVKSNYWIIILAALLIIGDKSLFIANAMPQSKLTIMTVIKQCAVIVTIIEGRIMFKESRFLYKLMCASVMILGIVLYII